MEEERGEIKNETFAKQLVLFRGIKYGSITPSDIDAVIDFGNLAWVIVEVKHENGTLGKGQRLLMERLVDNLYATKKHAIGFVVNHNSIGDIELATCKIIEYRWRNKWRTPKNNILFLEAVTSFLKMCGLERYLHKVN